MIIVVHGYGCCDGCGSCHCFGDGYGLVGDGVGNCSRGDGSGGGGHRGGWIVGVQMNYRFQM